MNTPRISNTLSHDWTPQSLRNYELLHNLSKTLKRYIKISMISDQLVTSYI
jgi:hypothetical protein